MLITDIYKTYRINKGLQEHMIRVAAVAQMICEHSPLQIDEKVVVSSCLLHDMGNLIKVKFDAAPELFEPEGIKYWKEVQKEMMEKYGDVESATNQIVAEIHPQEKVMTTVAQASLERMEEIAKIGTIEEKILEYADMRVGLFGVVSLEKRFHDIRERYVPHKHSKEYIDNLELTAEAIEKELFANTSIRPNDITDESTKKIQKELLNFDIH